jgi:hypothetical protein
VVPCVHVPSVVVVLELVAVVVLVLVLLDAVTEEVLVELVVLGRDVLVVEDDVVVEVVEVEETRVDVDDATVVEVLSDVVEEPVAEDEELVLVVVVVVVLVESADVVEDVLVEVVVVVVPTTDDPRSTLMRPVRIVPAMKLPVSLAPSRMRSVAPGAQNCALIREPRPNVASLPPTKNVRSRAPRPRASSMVTRWRMTTAPSTSTRAGDSTSSVVSRPRRRLENSYSPPARTSRPGPGPPFTSTLAYVPGSRGRVSPCPTLMGAAGGPGWGAGKLHAASRSGTIGPENGAPGPQPGPARPTPPEK